jgi:hypothetical protein
LPALIALTPRSTSETISSQVLPGSLRGVPQPRPAPVFIYRYEPEGPLLVALIPTGSVEPAEYDEVEAIHARMASDARRTGRRAAQLLIVETLERPNARTRKRLASSEERIGKLTAAFVAKSFAARTVLTLISWLTPQELVHRSIHGTYEDARDWLAKETNISSKLIDRLHGAVRELERQRRSLPQ